MIWQHLCTPGIRCTGTTRTDYASGHAVPGKSKGQNRTDGTDKGKRILWHYSNASAGSFPSVVLSLWVYVLSVTGYGPVCRAFAVGVRPVCHRVWSPGMCVTGYVVSVRPVLDRWPTFRDLLLEDCEEKFISLREAEGIGRPLGTADFVTELERRLGRSIARRAPGRKAVAIPVGEQLNLL
jgi:hypothetical protein